MAVTDIKQEILDWYNTNDTGEKAEYFDEIWEEFYEELITKEHYEKYKDSHPQWASVPVLPSGPVWLVEDFGGEGMGDTRYVVFQIGDQFFQVDGYYASWDGTTWEDPSPYEVKPVEVTKIEYRKA